MARQLAARDNRLILCARRETQLQQLAQEVESLGSQALILPCDARWTDEAAATVAHAIDAATYIDVAVLNMGAGPALDMSEASAEEILDSMELNYATLVNFLVPLIDHMKTRGQGLIAHTNSLAGFLGLPMQGPYCAAKAAARLLMDSCRLELKPYGIHVVSLYPGFVRTERVNNYAMSLPLSISEERAAEHMIRGIEREQANYLFPALSGWLVRLAQLLPHRVRSWIVTKMVTSQ